MPVLRFASYLYVKGSILVSNFRKKDEIHNYFGCQNKKKKETMLVLRPK